jgi:transposase-like protein
MARGMPSKPVQQMTTGQLDGILSTEGACAAYLIARRWPHGVICPRCESTRPYRLEPMKFVWECPDCFDDRNRFSHLTGTIFENSNYPLKTWLKIIHQIMTSTKPVTAFQISKTNGIGSTRAARHMCERIRGGFKEPQTMLGGIINDAVASSKRGWDQRAGSRKYHRRTLRLRPPVGQQAEYLSPNCRLQKQASTP